MESKILEILQSLQDGQKRMEIRLDSMENKMGLMENKMDLMENKMDLMENKIGSIETRIDSIESQINENTQILKALEHKVDVIKAEQENKTYLRKKTLSKIDNQIIELLKQGKTIAEIADELFYSKFTISKKIRNLKISGILDSKEGNSNNQTDKTSLSKYIKKANLISSLNSNYEHGFFSKAFKQAKAINDLGKLTLEDVDILAKALLVEPPTLENVINISRLYIDTKQYQKCIIFLEQAREFFNEEQKSKINELLLEIKTTIKNNQKNEIAVAK